MRGWIRGWRMTEGTAMTVRGEVDRLSHAAVRRRSASLCRLLPSPLHLPSSPLAPSRLTKRLDRRLDAPPFDRQPLGRRAGGRARAAASTGGTQRRLFIPASNTKLVVSAVGVGAAAAGLDRAHQPLRRRAGRRTACCRATWCSTAAAIRRSASAASRSTRMREGACETDLVHPAARAGRGASARAASARSTATSSATAATSSRSTVHPGWEAFDLNWWYAAPVSGWASTTTASTSPGHPAPRRARRR